MDSIITTILALFTLFYLLGKSADLAIANLQEIGKKQGIGIFFLGLIMGFFTSFPEMAIGINALINDIPNISLGNLFGGTMVLFGLILGANIFLQRKIKAEQTVWQFGLVLIFLFIPVLLGIDGQLGIIKGLIIIIAYFAIIFTIYHYQKNAIDMPHISTGKGIGKNIFLFLIGVILVLLIANFTINLTVEILSELSLSKFFVGLIVFAIGTSFPEIIIALRAWKNKVSELSLSNLLGSGMANMLLLGVFSVMRPFYVVINNSYYILVIAMAILLSLVFIFYKTDKALKRNEGIVLVLFYVLFVVSQIIFENPPQ
jgi:cation:H+ antiporter